MNPLDLGRERHVGATPWTNLKPGVAFPYIAYVWWKSAMPFSRDTVRIGSSVQIRRRNKP